MAFKIGGLGKGLDALLDENAMDSKGAVELNIREIEPNANQPRKDFDQESLNALAESIEKHGLLQPIIVRPKLNGTYEIVAGERRWRACRIAGLSKLPVIIKEFDELAGSEVALIENLQREDLNAYEEALGYKNLMDKFNLKQEQVAEKVGKSRTAVANAVRLLNLPEEILFALRNNEITAGHARALLAAKDPAQQKTMFALAKSGASVRMLEGLANKKEKEPKAASQENHFYTEVSLSLKQALHRKVKIKSTGKQKGTITLEFYSDDELADFAKRLAGE